MEKKKRNRKIPTYREWYEAHREQFERTERHYEERKAHWARLDAEEKAARGENAA